MKLYLDIVNGLTYNYANFQCEILYILGYTKTIKSGKFGDLNIHTHIHMFVIIV
jgi:hypothetical protein